MTKIPYSAPRRLLPLKPDVHFITGQRTTWVYARIKAGLFPPPIKLGRSSLWIEDELAAVNNAAIAGSTDAELRELVKRLIAARAQTRLADEAPLPAAPPAQHDAMKVRRHVNRNRASSSAK